jgi:hypothetical protein
MSNALATASLLDAIRAAILAAWGTMPISYGPPRTPLATTPYAVVLWDTVVISFDGPGGSIGNPSQQNSFSIIGRFPFPSDPTQIIALQKVSQANALIAQLQSGPSFASVGLLPLVTKVDATEPDDPNEKVYEITLTFSVVTVASHS